MALDPSKAGLFFENMTKKNAIVIISATYCTFCTKLKMLFIELKHRFVSLEIDIIPNGRELFNHVVSITAVHTVPQVFVRGKFIGGYDQVVDLFKRGELADVIDGKAPQRAS